MANKSKPPTHGVWYEFRAQLEHPVVLDLALT